MSLCISGILSAPTFQKSEGISWSPQEGPSILRNPPFSEYLRAQGFSKKIIAKGLGLPGIGKGEGTVEGTAKAGITSAGPLDGAGRGRRDKNWWLEQRCSWEWIIGKNTYAAMPRALSPIRHM